MIRYRAFDIKINDSGRVIVTYDFMAYDSKGEIGYLPIKNYEK